MFVGTGKPVLSFSSAHKLLDTAKAMKQAAPLPAAVPRELDKRPQLPYIVDQATCCWSCRPMWTRRYVFRAISP